MLEKWTKNLDIITIHEIIKKAEEIKGYKKAKKEHASLSYRVRQLPAIGTLQLSEIDEIEIENIVSRPHKDDVDLFFKIAKAMKGHSPVVMGQMDISESGKKYKQGEDFDVQYRYGFNAHSYTYGIQLGGISPGFRDAEYRMQLFLKFIEHAGLSDHLSLRINEDNILVNHDKEFIFIYDYSDRQALKDELKKGKIGISSTYGSIERGNFLSLIVQQKSMDGIREKIIETYNAYDEDRVTNCEFAIRVEEDTYEEIRGILNEHSVSTWVLNVDAKSNYNVDNLAKAIEDNESLLLPIFRIKNRDIGELEAFLYKREQEVFLSFESPYLSDKQEEDLEKLIVALADDKDILLDTVP